MSKPIEFKADTICDSCGRFGAFDLGDTHLCSDCYSERGSCCMEFGGNDLWCDDDRTESEKKHERK